MPTLACFIVAIDCVQYGLGRDQTIFTGQFAWLWFIIAFVWTMGGVNNLFRE